MVAVLCCGRQLELLAGSCFTQAAGRHRLGAQRCPVCHGPPSQHQAGADHTTPVTPAARLAAPTLLLLLLLLAGTVAASSNVTTTQFSHSTRLDSRAGLQWTPGQDGVTMRFTVIICPYALTFILTITEGGEPGLGGAGLLPWRGDAGCGHRAGLGGQEGRSEAERQARRRQHRASAGQQPGDPL